MTLRLRPSSFTSYADCGRRWAAAHLGGEIADAGYTLRQLRTNIGAVTGTSTHAGSTWALAVKMETGELGNMAEAVERGMASLREELADGASWDQVTPDLNTAQRQVDRQTRSFLHNIGRHLDPIMVESRLEAVRPSGAEVSGQVDIVVDAQVRLNDIKTGKQRRNNAVQYGTYARLLRAHGVPVQGIQEHYVPRVPLKQDQPPPVTVSYDLGAAEAGSELIMRRIERDVADWAERRSPDAFLPNPASVLCTERFCPAYGTAWCSSWKKD